jgi:hypothetical protein
LIDLEVHTAKRFGVYDGVVEWTCLDCEEDAALFPRPAKTHASPPTGPQHRGHRIHHP